MNKAATDYTNAPQQRILKLLFILAGNEFNGLSHSEIAAATKCAASMVTRDLFNLAEAGIAEQIQETGRWRLAPKMIQLSTSFSNALTRAETRLKEFANRYTREI